MFSYDDIEFLMWATVLPMIEEIEGVLNDENQLIREVLGQSSYQLKSLFDCVNIMNQLHHRNCAENREAYFEDWDNEDVWGPSDFAITMDGDDDDSQFIGCITHIWDIFLQIPTPGVMAFIEKYAPLDVWIRTKIMKPSLNRAGIFVNYLTSYRLNRFIEILTSILAK